MQYYKSGKGRGKSIEKFSFFFSQKHSPKGFNPEIVIGTAFQKQDFENTDTHTVQISTTKRASIKKTEQQCWSREIQYTDPF